MFMVGEGARLFSQVMLCVVVECVALQKARVVSDNLREVIIYLRDGRSSPARV